MNIQWRRTQMKTISHTCEIFHSFVHINHAQLAATWDTHSHYGRTLQRANPDLCIPSPTPSSYMASSRWVIHFNYSYHEEWKSRREIRKQYRKWHPPHLPELLIRKGGLHGQEEFPRHGKRLLWIDGVAVWKTRTGMFVGSEVRRQRLCQGYKVQVSQSAQG